MSLRITINVDPSLQKAVGQSRLEVSLPEKSSLADLFDHLRTTYPAFGEKLDGASQATPRAYNYFINRQAIRPHQLAGRQLQDGDEIHILTPVIGG